MKVRMNFVTNSSSSSFVIAFNKKPETIEDVKNELFGDRNWYRHPYDDMVYDSIDVAKTVFNDIANQTPAELNNIIEAITCGWFAGRIDYDDKRFKLPNDKFDWVAYEKANDEIAKDIAEKFIKDNSDKIFYTVSYADEDGSYFCALEHGNLFDRIPHIKISCH